MVELLPIAPVSGKGMGRDTSKESAVGSDNIESYSRTRKKINGIPKKGNTHKIQVKCPSQKDQDVCT